MPKFNILEEFDVAIKATARAAVHSTSSRKLAETFFEEEPQMMAAFDREWKIEKLTSLIARERGKLAQSRNARRQLGFGTVGKIVLRSGERYRDSNATLWVLQQLKKQLGATDHPALEQVNRRIAFLKPYAEQKRGITFQAACQLEFEKKVASLGGVRKNEQ